jgi:hypothetical protein
MGILWEIGVTLTTKSMSLCPPGSYIFVCHQDNWSM